MVLGVGALGLLLAPALLWLGALIVLPHVDLALLSFRERVGPRQYVPSLAQYKTFFAEPLYWHVFLRTAIMSVIGAIAALGQTPFAQKVDSDQHIEFALAQPGKKLYALQCFDL